MNDAIARMLDRYECQSVDDYVRALREIMQEIALLGLWRSKFFDKTAFYGGTALRILYGMLRNSGGGGAMEFLFFVTFSIAREYMVYKVKNVFRIKGHL